MRSAGRHKPENVNALRYVRRKSAGQTVEYAELHILKGHVSLKIPVFHTGIFHYS